MRIVFFTLVILLVTGCSHSIHLVHTSDFEPYSKNEDGKLVIAKTEQFTIMGFINDTNYVDHAYHDLQSKCKDGYIKGITTQYSTSHGFFSWHNKILMQGLCVTTK